MPLALLARMVKYGNLTSMLGAPAGFQVGDRGDQLGVA
jgi:hypothetical protein